MKLVDDWRNAHKWLSLHFSTYGFVLTSAAAALALSGAAVEWLSVFSLGIVLALAAVIFLLAFVGRLVSQKKPDADHDDTDQAGA
ncbi:MAG: hypothetical protein WA777_18500 [Rhodanobacter sp.]